MDSLDPDTKEDLSAIVESASRLDRLVEDLLELKQPKQDLLNLALTGYHYRLHDVKFKEKLLGWFTEYQDYCKMLQGQLDVINKINANPSVKSVQPSFKKKIKIQFYFFKNVHIPILIPIYLKLKELYPEIETAFSYKSYQPEIRAGFLPNELQLLKEYQEPMFQNPQDFKSDIIFIADSVYSWTQNCGKWVNVGHGVLSKGQYYTDTAIARREENADLVCVPGSFHQQILQKVISKPVVATGMAKLDDLYNKKLNRGVVADALDLSRDNIYILYAPTFNDELSSIPFWLDQLDNFIINPKIKILIKLHGSTKLEYKEHFRKVSSNDRRIYYIEDLDITPYLALADLMISDVSSAMMEFASLDKPLIIFNNPHRFSYKNYNPQDIEYKWRDIGIEVNNIDEAVAALYKCLKNPEFKTDCRKYYSSLLFANLNDGKACERIINSALKLLEGKL